MIFNNVLLYSCDVCKHKFGSLIQIIVMLDNCVCLVCLTILENVCTKSGIRQLFCIRSVSRYTCSPVLDFVIFKCFLFQMSLEFCIFGWAFIHKTKYKKCTGKVYLQIRISLSIDYKISLCILTIKHLLMPTIIIFVLGSFITRLKKRNQAFIKCNYWHINYIKRYKWIKYL